MILKRKAIPEFVQDECTPEALSAEFVQLITNPSARIAQVTASAEADQGVGARRREAQHARGSRNLDVMREPKTQPQTKEAAPEGAASLKK